MRHFSALVRNSYRAYRAFRRHHVFAYVPVFALAAPIALCPAAYAFVTAADFNGRESGIASSNIHSPLGVAVDGSGNLYIAQSDGVLKETLSPDGSGYTETLVAAMPGMKHVAIAVDGIGNVYLGVSGAVLKETLSDDGYRQSTVASDIQQPDWIAVDGKGNVYIADNADSRVLRETPDGGRYVSSVVFPPAEGSNLLDGLAVDASGNVYFVNSGSVWKATPSAAGYRLNIALPGSYGRGLAVDGAGDLYLTVGNTQVLQETLLDGKYTQSTVATAHVPVAAGLAVDDRGNLYVSDLEGNRVLKEYASSAPVGSAVSLLSAPEVNDTH
jgi:hypothetical protein